MNKIKVLLDSPILTMSGYGENSRYLLRALRKYPEQFDIYLSSLSWGNTNWLNNISEERDFIDKTLLKTIEYMQHCQQNKIKQPYDIHVHVGIPHETQRKAPRLVHVTALCESTKISPKWVECLQQMDEIIVVSSFNKQVIENTAYSAQNKETGEVINNFRVSKPITVINHPVQLYEPKEIDLKLTTKFNFLTVGLWSIRKNLDNTIKWFIEEFIDNSDVGLVLKISTKGGSELDKEFTKNRLQNILNQYPKRKCKIYFLHGDMTNEEMAGLYNSVNAYVGISHGESAGLPLLESATHGLPIVSINWGGQCDFLNMPRKKDGKVRPHFATVEYDLKTIQKEAIWDPILIENSLWAYPRQGSFKMRLREIYKNYSRFKSMANQLKKWVRKEFHEDKVYKKYVETIMGEKIIDVKNEDLPKVSIITSVYDAKEHLEGFLKNVEQQTIFGQSELVLVHPHSSPDFVWEQKLIKQFKKKYENIIYKVTKDHITVYEAWNIGIDISSGRYLSNWNVDERKSPVSLVNHAKALYVYKDVDLVYSDNLVTRFPNETWENNSSNGQLYARMEDFSIEAMLRGNAPHCSPMWRKSIHEKHGMFNTEYFSASDWEMWLRASFGGSKFKKINDVSILYYFNPKGVSTNKETDVAKRKEEMKIFQHYRERYTKSDYVKV